MKIINYSLYYLLLIPISNLPFWLLYGISDVFYVLIYKIVKYRVKVVKDNISKAFPEKTKTEIISIEKAFYHHFCDLIVESIKMFSISKSNMTKRMYFNNPELVQKYIDNNIDIAFVAGHFNNWEMGAFAMPIHLNFDLYGIYKPLTNRFFDKKVRKSRERFGMKLISMRQVGRTLLSKTDKAKATVFISDQSPANWKSAIWCTFMGRNTPVLAGTAKSVKRLNMPLVFTTINKVKRGFYTVTLTEICEQNTPLSIEEITKKHTKKLEEDIFANPQYWLWTHRRWKHSDKYNA